MLGHHASVLGFDASPASHSDLGVAVTLLPLSRKTGLLGLLASFPFGCGSEEEASPARTAEADSILRAITGPDAGNLALPAIRSGSPRLSPQERAALPLDLNTLGFIGLAAMIFGRWHPVGALAAALVFGFTDSLQQKLALLQTPIPSEFLAMAPYIATIIVVAGLVGRARAPAADGKPYVKD